MGPLPPLFNKQSVNSVSARPELKIRRPLENLEGQSFFMYNYFLFVCACVDIKGI